MKKITLSVILLGFTFNDYSAQQVTVHIENAGIFYVEKNVLTSINGGVQIKGKFKNRGNVLLQGFSDSVFKTLKEDGSNAEFSDLQNGTSGQFLNILNNPDNYELTNTTALGNNYSYGQLYISNFNQANIKGFASAEYRNVNHGAYQQIGLPFFLKNLTELNDELGKTFSTRRWTQNEILKWNNNKVVFDNLDYSQPLNDATGYYILGNKNNSLNLSSVTRLISGQPYTDGYGIIKSIENAGQGINFGTNGSAINQYNERYNSYLQDGFELQSSIGGTAWQGNYGKNLYQFSNPFLTNLDLRNIFIDETNGDNVYISNIYAIRLEQASGTVSYTPNVGGGSTSFRYVTWDSSTNSPVGDVDWLMVRPFGTFVIKLKDNSIPGQTINFNNLRRFAYTPRTSSSYSVNAARISQSKNTLKQLGIIALDAEGKEIGRTYYVVSKNAKSGHQNLGNFQISASSSNVIGSFEENALNGGYDNAYTSKYWLYINEANEEDFQGKAIPMMIYSSNVKSLKFELRENAELSQELSSGKSFFYSINGNLNKVSQNGNVPVSVNSSLSVKLYYGEPQNTLSSEEVLQPSRTMVVYNPNISKYFVKFDKNWKTADVSIFDASGKIISKKENVNCHNDFIIDENLVSGLYILKITSDNGESTTSKILMK